MAVRTYSEAYTDLTVDVEPTLLKNGGVET
jgi:hypothetical protein